MLITFKEIRNFFKYDNGKLIWSKTTGKKTKKGDIAGCLTPSGYRSIRVNKKLYLEHRLIWFFHYGYFPENDLDHINRNKADNKIENLREVSKSCNARNCGNQINNISGVKGVHFQKFQKVWVAHIWVAGKEHYLGQSRDFNEAILHRYAAEQCLEWENCNSDSPAYQYALKNNLIKKRKGNHVNQS